MTVVFSYKEFSNIAKSRVPAGLDTEQWIDNYNRIYAQLLSDAYVQLLDCKGHAAAADEIRKWVIHD